MAQAGTERRSDKRITEKRGFESGRLRRILTDIGRRTDGEIDVVEAAEEAVERWTAAEAEYCCKNCGRGFELHGELTTHQSGSCPAVGGSHA